MHKDTFRSHISLNGVWLTNADFRDLISRHPKELELIEKYKNKKHILVK